MDKYLAEILLDSLDCYLDVLGFDEDQIEAMYIDNETGNVLDDVSFINRNGKKILSLELIDAAYSFICDVNESPNDELDYDIEDIVRYLVNKYVIYHYGDKKNKFNYFKKNDLEVVTERFITDYDFGIELLTPTYLNMSGQVDYYKQIAKIMKNNDGKLLNIYNKDNNKDMYTINDVLRNVICNLYNYYISIGCNDIESLNLTWAYFISDIDPLEELQPYMENDISRWYLKQSMINIMFSDLYEDCLNGSIIQSENYEDRLADFLPVFCVSLGFTTIPGQPHIRNRILKHFILLQEEKEKRKENRIKTYEDGREMVLRKINNMSTLDDIQYLK